MAYDNDDDDARQRILIIIILAFCMCYLSNIVLGFRRPSKENVCPPLYYRECADFKS